MKFAFGVILGAIFGPLVPPAVRGFKQGFGPRKEAR